MKRKKKKIFFWIILCSIQTIKTYVTFCQVGILLNSLKRMLDILRPRIESQFKSWASCLPNAGNTAPGERLSEVTVMLRAKFRNYLQAIVEKLVENVRFFCIFFVINLIFDTLGKRVVPSTSLLSNSSTISYERK